MRREGTRKMYSACGYAGFDAGASLHASGSAESGLEADLILSSKLTSDPLPSCSFSGLRGKVSAIPSRSTRVVPKRPLYPL